VLSHARIWAAIDRLAERNHLTASGLARSAGLDPTTFNKSKRASPDGRPRWPSTESIAKILAATRTEVGAFLGLTKSMGLTKGVGLAKGVSPKAAAAERRTPSTVPLPTVPLLGMAQAGAGGFFDDGGYPAGQGWDEVSLPASGRDNVFALKVSGDSMLPLYRHGDTIIVQRDNQVHKGDRVVVRTTDGEVMAKVLQKKTARAIDLASLNPAHKNRTIPMKNVDWIARIIWASQ
jgi:phage repressor protein C with HTH and peptisase S24 domain